MARVLVLYYSAYGHIETMANAVAEGAREGGASVDIRRVPELVPEDVARKSYYKVDQKAPIAKIEDLANYDAVVIGAGTRFGRLASQMANFLDQAGGLWMRGALHGKVGGAFTSSATQHGGQETTLFSIITNLLHFGMIIVGLDYGHAGQMTLSEITSALPTASPSLTTIKSKVCSEQIGNVLFRGLFWESSSRSDHHQRQTADRPLRPPPPLRWESSHKCPIRDLR